MSPRGTRIWFAATAFCVIAGVVISAVTAANDNSGHFHPGVARAANAFAFFTIQSNILIGVATLLLAVRLDRGSVAFRVLRLSGLVAITVTGIVFHVALARILDLHGWAAVGNQLVHTVVPVMALVGWLLAGPRGWFNRRVAWLSLIFPVFWLAFTLVRGAIAHWYPYPFIDVTTLGYGRVALNCVWVAVLMLGVAAGATVLDQRLPPEAAAAPAPGRAGSEAARPRPAGP
jgi:hypothetical protein